MRDKALGELSLVKVPLLLIYSENDELMKNETIHAQLEAGVPARLLQERTLHNDFHLALIEDTRRVTQEVVNWITSR